MRFHCTIDGCPNKAVAVYYMPEGCYCKHDSYQGLCEQHYETSGGGPMFHLMELPEDTAHLAVAPVENDHKK